MNVCVCVFSLAWAIFCSNACCGDYADDFHNKCIQFFLRISIEANDWDFILSESKTQAYKEELSNPIHEAYWIFDFQKKKKKMKNKQQRVMIMNCSKLFRPRRFIYIYFINMRCWWKWDFRSLTRALPTYRRIIIIGINDGRRISRALIAFMKKMKE